jgi:hypothetical protein
MKNIQILVRSPNALEKISDYNNTHPDDPFTHALVKVSLMKDDCYLVLIPFNILDSLEAHVTALQTTIEYMGCWDIDGSKVIFDADKEYRNFNKSLYIESLKVPESGVAYGEVDIDNVRVDFFAGWGSRDLS